MPAPKRHMPWSTFLRAHWKAIAATDFFTVEAWTLRGLTRFHVFFVIDLSTRRVNIAGITDQANGRWVKQVTRSLVDSFDGFLSKHRFLIHDRDPLFTESFQALLLSAGVSGVKSVRGFGFHQEAQTLMHMLNGSFDRSKKSVCQRLSPLVSDIFAKWLKSTPLIIT